MRGWFQVILGSRVEPDLPTRRGFSKKRLIGFETTTFCMASTPASGVFRTGTSQFAGDLQITQSALALAIRTDVRRYAAFRELLVGSSRIEEGGSNRLSEPVDGAETGEIGPVFQLARARSK
jgi:hypothetical protein